MANSFNGRITKHERDVTHSKRKKVTDVYTFSNQLRCKLFQTDSNNYRVCLSTKPNSAYYPFATLIRISGDNKVKAWMIPYIMMVAEKNDELKNTDWNKNLILLSSDILRSTANLSVIHKLSDIELVFNTRPHSDLDQVGYTVITEAGIVNESDTWMNAIYKISNIMDNTSQDADIVILLDDRIWVGGELWESLEFQCLDEEYSWEASFYDRVVELLGDSVIDKFEGLGANFNKLVMSQIHMIKLKGVIQHG